MWKTWYYKGAPKSTSFNVFTRRTHTLKIIISIYVTECCKFYKLDNQLTIVGVNDERPDQQTWLHSIHKPSSLHKKYEHLIKHR